jgi:hypothetical protein
MRYSLIILLFVLAACNLNQENTPEAALSPQTTRQRLVVAWAESGNLLVWQTGESLPRRIASGGVVHPYIAPDGQHILFTRGPNGAPETLWVVDSAGTAEQQLVGERPRGYTAGENQLGDVVWLDETIFYINTLVQRAPFFEPVNDLYRGNIRTREIALIRSAGEGGRIYSSPDGQSLITVYHGTYSEQDGLIQVLDPLGQSSDNLLFFVGVSTGSEYAFYPGIHWLPDSSAVLVAIPDADLIYGDTAENSEVPFTRLWRLPLANPSDRELIGSLRVSFFGLPRWSSDGSAMTFLRRTGTNEFSAYLADGRGENESLLYSGIAGQIEQPSWIENSNRYYFAQANSDKSLTYYLGGIGLEAVRLSEEPMFTLNFVSPENYVYVAQGEGRLELRYSQIGGESQFIGSLSSLPVFDALLLGD